MNKRSALYGAFALTLVGFSGCFLLNDPPVTYTAHINFSPRTTLPLIVGDTIGAPFSGSFDCSNAPFFAYNVKNAENAWVVEYFKLDLDDPSPSVSKADFYGSIKANSSATPPGNYILYLSIFVGSEFTADSIALTVRPPLKKDSATVKLNGNPLACLLELDGMNAYDSSQAIGKLPNIDLCYLFSKADTSKKIFSPAQAVDSKIPLLPEWAGTPNATKFYKLSSVTFDSVKRVSQLDSLWDESKVSNAAIIATKNDLFIAKTDLKTTALFLIADQDTSAGGSIKLKFAR
jgi:hypothetical protein